MITTFDWIVVGLFCSPPVIIGVSAVVMLIRSELQYKREMRVIHNREMESLYLDCLSRIDNMKEKF
jgi:hypothetical protein